MKNEFLSWIESIKTGLEFAGLALLVPFAALGISALAIIISPMLVILGFTGLLAKVDMRGKKNG